MDLTDATLADEDRCTMIVVGLTWAILVREVFKKSKWKFKMAFAMKGGGSRRGLKCHIPILKNDFF